MSKITLNNIEAGYLSNTAYNTNNDSIVTAFENTLSRDGTSPNQMEANLDMNSHRILNLVDATTNQEPVTFKQLQDAATISITVPAGPTTSDLVTHTPSGAGASARIMQTIVRENIISVKDYGGTGNGVADDTTAFSNAAIAASAGMNVNGNRGTAVSHADMAAVYVPAGTWNITSEVGTNNRDIIWECAPGAIFSGNSENFLSGRIVRSGYRNSGVHHGNVDYATGYSVACNQRQGFHDYSAGNLGFTVGPSQLASHKGGDSIGLYVENSSVPVTVDAASATYTATTATIPAPSATALKRYRKGMILRTKHVTPWMAVLESWNADGTVLTVQEGWYLYGGGGVASIPTNDGTGLYVNAFKKTWAHNANVHLLAAADAPTVSSASGFELGTLNYRADSTVPFVDEPNRCWGFDSVSLGTFKPHSAFIARTGESGANWRHGFYALNSECGFKYQGAGTPIQFVTPTTEQTNFSVNASGNLFIGNQSAVVTNPQITFYANGSSVSSARIGATGGTGTPNQGTYFIRSALVDANSNAQFTAATTEDRKIDVGLNRAGSGNSYINLIGDTTYTAYGARLLRGSGANGATTLTHRGTGSLVIKTEDAANIVLQPAGATSVNVKANGAVRFIPTTTPAAADAGDVYYDSGTNKLRCYDGAIWNDLF